jgi:hypothetical protein
MQKRLIVSFIFLSCGLFAQEQTSFKNLNDFKDQAGNWQIVGDVTVNRGIDVHHQPTEEHNAKKRKKKKNKNAPAPLQALEFTAGTGIALNINNKGQRDALVTNWEHGDLKLEIEVLLPKGSNSGIYLQGRYEFQLRDSWDVKNPLMSDMGGIHNNWEKSEDKIYRGMPPMSNAAKAPGLWQKIKIHFQAPRFNSAGEKIANAKFVTAELNGVLVLSNVEVPSYTGGPIEKNEVAMGPLLIQGNHGPVALRNFKYQLLKEDSVELTSLSYKIYKGEFKGLEDINDDYKVAERKAKKIDIHTIGEEDNYGIIYVGKINIEEEDTYTFSVGYTGGVKLILDNKTLIENNSPSAEALLQEEIKLTKGSHSFKLINIKSAEWRAPKLGLTIESAATNPKSFHVFDSYPSRVNSRVSILVDAERKPRMLRGFVDFKGREGEYSQDDLTGKRLSHTIGVGTTQGVNFVYDLGAANLVGMWRGNFIDATNMWRGRGNGSFNARGAVNWTFLNQPIAQLETPNSVFPETGVAPNFVAKGYSIDKNSGLPIFKHEYKGVAIENKVTVDATETYLIQEVSFSKKGLTNWYLKLASGDIQKSADGAFVIGGKQYYINVLSGQTPTIREVDGVSELVLQVDGSSIKYEIIW